jgi:hypothetical protein
MSNANGHRWSKFWWQDWENDEDLKLCSFAAQGVWMRALCLMHKSGGYLLLGSNPANYRDLARLWGAEPRQIERCLLELVQRNVARQTEGGVIFCQRMVNDFKASAQGQEHIKKRWNGHKPGSHPNRSPKREATPDPITRSLEAESEAEGAPKSPPPDGGRDRPPPEEAPSQFGTRADGTNPRAMGTNPRRRRFRNGALELIVTNGLETHKPLADSDELSDQVSSFMATRRLLHGSA